MSKPKRPPIQEVFINAGCGDRRRGGKTILSPKAQLEGNKRAKRRLEDYAKR